MQLIAISGRFVSLGIFLGASVTAGRQFTDGLPYGLAELTFKSFLDNRLPLFTLGRTASLAWLLLLFHLPDWFLPANNGCRITADMPKEFTLKVVFYQGIVCPATEFTGGKLSEGS
jgi:hypothetical protein